MSAPAGAPPADRPAPPSRRRDRDRDRVTVTVVALVAAVVAALATYVLLGTARPAYAATASVALVPAPGIRPDQVDNAWKDINNGRATAVAVVVFRQQQWEVPAAEAAGVGPDEVAVTAAMDSTLRSTLIKVSVTTTSPSGAEAAVAAVVDKAGATIAATAGPVVVHVTDSSADSAEASPKPRAQILIIVALAAGLVGAGAGSLWVRRKGSRPTTG